MKLNGEKIQTGDVITVNGRKAQVKEVVVQHYFEEDGYDAEFYDTYGNYRSWKQRVDGGYVER